MRSEPPRPRSARSNGEGGAARPGREPAIGLAGSPLPLPLPPPLPPPFLPLPGANRAPASVRVWPRRPRLDAARARCTKELGAGERGALPGDPAPQTGGEGARSGTGARPGVGIAAAEGTRGLEAGHAGSGKRAAQHWGGGRGTRPVVAKKGNALGTERPLKVGEGTSSAAALTTGSWKMGKGLGGRGFTKGGGRGRGRACPQRAAGSGRGNRRARPRIKGAQMKEQVGDVGR